MDLKGKRALVTGASSGMGEAYARQLAARGAALVIVARRAERLEALARELRDRHRVEVEVIGLDLSKADAAQALFDRTEGAAKPVDVVINNAGFGTKDYFLDIPWEKLSEQIQLNATTVAELTWRFGRAMRDRKGGHILNVASIGAYTPSPVYANYSATKAYVRDLTEAAAFELRGSGVRLCSVCPGLVKTEFHQVAGHDASGLSMVTMSADKAARIGLDALFGGRRNIVPGWYNKLQTFFFRLIPRRWMVFGAAMAMGKPERPALPAKSG
jgi:uncharacterized protein